MGGTEGYARTTGEAGQSSFEPLAGAGTGLCGEGTWRDGHGADGDGGDNPDHGGLACRDARDSLDGSRG